MVLENVMVFRDVTAYRLLDVSREPITSIFRVKNKVNMKVMGWKMEGAVSYKTLCHIPETIFATVIAPDVNVGRVYRFCQDGLFFVWNVNVPFVVISKELLFLDM
jgi:hypothetical protein